ncbi:MAG: hypothetical protein PGN25_07880 [Methylorubrum populi]
MESRDSVAETLRHAAGRLAAKGLMQPEDTLSQRIPERAEIVRITRPADGGPAQDVVWESLDRSVARDPHHAVYAARRDVGAILEGRQRWGAAIGRLGRPMPALFDEQVRHLGSEVPLAAGPVPTVPGASTNALVWGDRVLCFGMGLERLLLNAELLEKCAQAFVLSAATGRRVRRVPWWVRLIANRRLSRDEGEAAERHGRGERSVMKAGY